jgi:uncharacterized protein (TIGR04222 family)
MNSVWNQSLAIVHGPYFVFLLTALGIAALIVGGAWIWLCDPTRDDDLSEVSLESLDPCEIAWLRSGAVGVMKVTVADLLLQGLLEKHRPPKWLGLFTRKIRLRQRGDALGSSSLTNLQKTAWTWFATPRFSRDIVDSKTGLTPLIAPLCVSYEASLEERKLLETAAHKIVRRVVAWTMSLAILTVGLYLLVLAVLTEQRAVFPLLAMMVAGLVSTAIVCRETRLSNLGQRFVEQVRLEYDAQLADVLASGNQNPLSRWTISSQLLGVALVDPPPIPRHHGVQHRSGA